jgi:hypothetical protein
VKKLTLILLMFCAFTIKAQPNLILNGSFEDNIITTCYMDTYPNDFNDSVANITSFGSNLGMLNDSCPGCPEFPGTYWGGGAQEGHWFMVTASRAFYSSVGNGWSRSIFSFHLSDTLNNLTNYKLSFYIKKPPVPPVITPTCYSTQNNSINIGVSSSATNYGTIIYQSPLGGLDWTQHSVVFNITNTAEYITVQTAIGDTNDYVVFIDNFVLVETTEQATVSVTVNNIPHTSNCINNACIDPLDGTGTYSNFYDCAASCSTTATNEIQANPKKYLLKIVDVLGKESKPTATGLLFYIYSDGTVEKRIIIE